MNYVINDECALDSFEFPSKCVVECCTLGKNDEAVAKWVKKLGFKVDISWGACYLDQYGIEGVEDFGIDEITPYVFWLAVWNQFERGEAVYD